MWSYGIAWFRKFHQRHRWYHNKKEKQGGGGGVGGNRIVSDTCRKTSQLTKSIVIWNVPYLCSLHKDYTQETINLHVSGSEHSQQAYAAWCQKELLGFSVQKHTLQTFNLAGVAKLIQAMHDASSDKLVELFCTRHCNWTWANWSVKES